MYQKLGGKEAIEGVVDEFYTRVFADDEVKNFFEGINKRKLKAHQVDNPANLHAEPVQSCRAGNCNLHTWLCGLCHYADFLLFAEGHCICRSLTSWQLVVCGAVLVLERRHAS